MGMKSRIIVVELLESDVVVIGMGIREVGRGRERFGKRCLEMDEEL